ncbi:MULTISPECIES: hypothetical protein [unclassified Rhizobium]|uniref:hypothetical protein n=1 Tax=Rhizobium sp. PP-CC-3G-465 TaxID=2135648 RepID=UPI000D8E2FE9|nr:hypothetical protein C8J37_12514 [Rhizobium sp. PP-WC-1G-195]TCQ05465.1 hypothetical protein C8J34_107196 [Rhizobium sp. PP-F2F-G36]TCQ13313.1 hypothetical protein C8J33_1355 [Rhizobium sp. PP-CC-3G-465]
MNYEIDVCSDSAYEELIAEIRFEHGDSVVVSQEHSRDQFEVSIYSHIRNTDELPEQPNLIDLDDFLCAVAKAKERLRLLDVPRA